MNLRSSVNLTAVRLFRQMGGRKVLCSMFYVLGLGKTVMGEAVLRSMFYVLGLGKKRESGAGEGDTANGTGK